MLSDLLKLSEDSLSNPGAAEPCVLHDFVETPWLEPLAVERDRHHMRRDPICKTDLRYDRKEPAGEEVVLDGYGQPGSAQCPDDCRLVEWLHSAQIYKRDTHASRLEDSLSLPGFPKQHSVNENRHVTAFRERLGLSEFKGPR